jgi:hypothetical protein
VTWAFLRSEDTGLGSLGLVPTQRRILELGGGFAVAAAVFALVALARAALVGASWSFGAVPRARVLLSLACPSPSC